MPCNLSNEIIYKEELNTDKIHYFLEKTNDIIQGTLKVCC